MDAVLVASDLSATKGRLWAANGVEFFSLSQLALPKAIFENLQARNAILLVQRKALYDLTVCGHNQVEDHESKQYSSTIQIRN